jgi:hypothetical protein
MTPQRLSSGVACIDAESRKGEAGASMLKGLYKIEVETRRGSGCGVMVARDGKVFGGNAAFAFAGDCREAGERITVELATLRHNDGLDFKPVFGTGPIVLDGRCEDQRYLFEGGTPQLADIAFRAVATEISEEAAPPAGASGPGGIRNGLYSLTIRMLDGIDRHNTGIMVLHDGAIRGGDALFDYVGAYSSAEGRWKGEIINHEHTPSRGERPIFGGYEVGIGFSGTYDNEGAEGEATALAGKRSIRFKAVLRKLVDTGA